MKKQIAPVFVFFSFFLISNALHATTYFWQGTAGGGDGVTWTQRQNWVTFGILSGYTTAGSYPGASTARTDVADFSFYYLSNLNFSTINVTLGSTLTAPLKEIEIDPGMTVKITLAASVTLSTAGIKVGYTDGIGLGSLMNIGLTTSSLTLACPISATYGFSVNGTIISGDNYGFVVYPYSSVTNAGTLNIINGSYLDIYDTNASLTNSGSVTINSTSSSGTVYDNGTGTSALTNTGTFNLIGGAYNLNTIAGSITNAAGSFTLTSSSINFQSKNCTLLNNGTGSFTLDPTSSITFSSAANTGGNTVTNNSSGPFTLMSSQTSSATIGAMNQAGLTGDMVKGTSPYNVQRFLFGNSTTSSPGIYAYRNYKLISSPVNMSNSTYSAQTSTNSLIDLSYLGQSVTLPSAVNGAYIAGPAPNGATFGTIGSHTSPNALLYLYQESVEPPANQTTFYQSKSAGVMALNTAAHTVTATNTATNGIGNNIPGVYIPVGNAYLFYYIGDNSRQTATNPLANVAPNSCTATAIGYMNQGNILFYLWGTAPTAILTNTPAGVTSGSAYAGITVVGNPYPSSIDLKKLYADNTAAVSASFYELNDLNHQYDGYNASSNTTSGSTQASEYVESGQGFYVVATAGKSLTFKEDEKVANMPAVSELAVRNPTGPSAVSITAHELNTPAAFADSALLASSKRAPAMAIKSATSNTGLHLKLMQDSVNFDECGIYFDRRWSDNFDINDSPDLDGMSGQVYLSSYTADRVRSSINTLSMFTSKGKRIPLYVKFATAGIFSLAMEDIENINTNQYSVFLIDNKLKDSLDLTLYKSYNFNYTPGTANDSTRFVLAIEHKPVPHYALLSFSGAKSTDGVLLDWKTINEGASVTYVLQKLAANNTYVFLDSLHSDSSGAYSYIDQHPILGNNTYRLQQTDALGDITYSAPVTIGYNSSSPNGGLNVYPNPAKSMITVTLTTSSTVAQAATADIYNMSGTLIEHKVVNSNSFTQDVSAYQLGVYIIELKNNNGVLVGKSKFVKVQ